MTSSDARLYKWLEIAPGLSLCKLRAYLPDVGAEVCPPPADVFRLLELLSPEDVRVVILGQDPYHTEGKASGIAFGYHRQYKGPVDSSLANIQAEVLRCYPNSGITNDLSLEQWVHQGVLLLNTRLSVELGRPMSHARRIGWETEILSVLKFLNSLHDKDCIWLSWGSEARQVVEQVVGDLSAPNVISTSHPCRYSHKATSTPFTGSNCFTRVNQYLNSIGREEIQW